MSMPRPDEESKAFFASVVPVDPRITIKPMFGNIGSFINGNMFGGLFGNQIFVRLPENERLLLLEEEGASEFSPMPGRAMKEYVTLPEKWRNETEMIHEWIQKSLDWVGAMPEKLPGKKGKKQ
ncbi:MAG TPA: TfoX/Sxy family protein [Pseudoneobacillus sp.]|nr:TfoX/Sxy family protein [Pseudoneobacillus sp.]